MNVLKIAVLTVAIVVAVTALAAPAGATTLTSPPGTTFAGTIRLESVGSMSFKFAFGTVQCSSTTEGKIVSSGAGVPVGISLSSWALLSCSGGTATPLKPGSADITATSGGNGTWVASGSEANIHTVAGDCILTTSKTVIGTLTGGSPAYLDVSGVIPRTGGSGLCGSSATWTGTYKVTAPSTLTVD